MLIFALGREEGCGSRMSECSNMRRRVRNEDAMSECFVCVSHSQIPLNEIGVCTNIIECIDERVK